MSRRPGQKEESHSHPCHIALIESTCKQIIRTGSQDRIDLKAPLQELMW